MSYCLVAKRPFVREDVFEFGACCYCMHFCVCCLLGLIAKVVLGLICASPVDPCAGPHTLSIERTFA